MNRINIEKREIDGKVWISQYDVKKAMYELKHNILNNMLKFYKCENGVKDFVGIKEFISKSFDYCIEKIEN